MERASFALKDGDHSPQTDLSVPSTQARQNVTDLDHSFTAILTHTQQLLSSDPIFAKIGSSAAAQLTTAPKVSLISKITSFWSRTIQRRQRSGDLNPSRNNPTTTGELTLKSGGISRKAAADLLRNDTTLASVIENQRLVVVNSHNQIFDILTPAQQTDLKYYISRVMKAYQQSRMIVPRSSKRLSVKTVLPLRPSNDDVLTTILNQAEQLLSPSQTAQLTISPKSNFLAQAKSFLTNAQPSTRHPGELQPPAHHQPPSRQLTQRSTAIDPRANSVLHQQGITLASTIDNRHLVLVNAQNEIFDILTPGQQTDLIHYISRVMRTNRQSRTIVPRQPQRLSGKTILAIVAVFITALPVELKKAWSQIAPGPEAPSLPPIASNGLQAEPQSRIFYPKASAPGTVKARSRRLPHNPDPMGQVNARRLTSNSPDAFEANVNDVNYLEHPLEKLLRLIDRMLTWCENRWQQWRRHS